MSAFTPDWLVSTTLIVASVLVTVAFLVWRVSAHLARPGPSEASEWDLRDPGMVEWTDTETVHAWAVRPEHAGRTITLPDGSIGMLTRVHPWDPHRPRVMRLAVDDHIHTMPGDVRVRLGARPHADHDADLAAYGW